MSLVKLARPFFKRPGVRQSRYSCTKTLSRQPFNVLLGKMAGIEEQYVKLLRQAVRSASTSCVCVLCEHRIANARKRDFLKHLDTAHGDDLTFSKEDLEAKSRAPGLVLLFSPSLTRNLS
jgi:hypothetical protein